MKKYTYLIAAGLMVASGALFAADTQKGEAILKKIINDAEARQHNTVGAWIKFNWKRIFDTIDSYNIDPLTFDTGGRHGRVVDTTPAGKKFSIRNLKTVVYGDGSLLQLAIANGAVDAIKTLMTKYNVPLCNEGSNCDDLFYIAFANPGYSFGEGSPVPMTKFLLEHGAKPSEKILKDKDYAEILEDAGF